MPTPYEILTLALPTARNLDVKAYALFCLCINRTRRSAETDLEKARTAAREVKRLADEIEKALEG